MTFKQRKTVPNNVVEKRWQLWFGIISFDYICHKKATLMLSWKIMVMKCDLMFEYITEHMRWMWFSRFPLCCYQVHHHHSPVHCFWKLLQYYIRFLLLLYLVYMIDVKRLRLQFEIKITIEQKLVTMPIMLMLNPIFPRATILPVIDYPYYFKNCNI